MPRRLSALAPLSLILFWISVLPDQDEDSVEYLAGMLEDYSMDADDDIVG